MATSLEHSIVANHARSGRYTADTFIASVLFAASAAVVVWQNFRLTILWDVSYVLENATRMAAGDVPYRDFPFPYAPLTFMTQAAIIRIFGRAYWHHIAYAALACGAASVVTYCIVRRIVARPLAAILCAPLIPLGIYCILPIPFYDPDCCLAILIAIAAVFSGGQAILPVRTGRIACPPFFAGALSVVPLLIKQNIGIAFVAVALILFLLQRMWRSLAGLVAAIAVSAAVIAIAFGASNYIQWTVRYATARRLPPLSQLLSIYNDSDLWWWIAVCLIAILFRHARWLILVPFLWSEYQFFFDYDASDAEVNFLHFWPLFLVLGLFNRRFRIPALLIFASVHGAFLSQVIWGSTYGIWPLLIILIAIVISSIDQPLIIAIVISVVLLHFGSWYIWNNDRLMYAKWNEGAMFTSSLPPLRGMHIRGEWLPDFEELVAFTNTHIPSSDAILSLPGEDLFYFTTGRRPRVPVLMFDHTVNPYSPEQIAAFNVQWVIVKQRLQVNGDPFPELGRTLELLRPQLQLVARLKNYDVYRRLSAIAAN